jgi:hypothetical protein
VTAKVVPIVNAELGQWHGQAGVNLSGKPEAVLTNEQWRTLQKVASGTGGGLTVNGGIHINPTAPARPPPSSRMRCLSGSGESPAVAGLSDHGVTA